MLPLLACKDFVLCVRSSLLLVMKDLGRFAGSSRRWNLMVPPASFYMSCSGLRPSCASPLSTFLHATGGCSILRPSVRLSLLSYAMLFVSTKPSGTCIIACLHCICIAQSSYSTVKRSIKLCQACERRARACVSCRLRLRLQPRACLDMCVGWGGLFYYRGLRGLGWFSLRSKTRS